MTSTSAARTAFVLAGGGSLGALQVGMLKALTRAGMVPDFVVGASVDALNGAYFAALPDGVVQSVAGQCFGVLHPIARCRTYFTRNPRHITGNRKIPSGR